MSHTVGHCIYILDCPCELFCPEGCTGCDNLVCTETTVSPDVTTTSQPDTTTSPTVNAVLILNTVSSANVPMIVDFEGQYIFLYISVSLSSGNINENLAFEYGVGATAKYGCGATLNGEFWYFGNDKQVSFAMKLWPIILLF